MDIKNLMKTYLHVNDPKLANVTMKFAIFVVAAVGLSLALVLGTVYLGGDEGAPGVDGTAAETGDGLDRHCLQSAELATWQAEHPEAEIVETESMEGQRVCITYRATAS